MTTALFHLAFPVYDIERTREFYVNLLGCEVGRESERWIDFKFFGHQISAHLVDNRVNEIVTNSVDSKAVPARHFGVILDWQQWHTLAERLRTNGTVFYIQPYIRFQGEVGEQATMFIKDPSDNYLEFKSFKNMNQVFAT